MSEPSSLESLAAFKRRQAELWQSGTSSRLEDLTSDDDRRRLGDDALFELLVAEVEWRQAAGGAVSQSEYVGRFPQLRERLVAFFAGDPESKADTASHQTANDNTTTHGGVSAPTEAAIPKSVGGFRVIRRIGSGGMGQVFEVEDPELGRRLALKRPHLEHDPTVRERFLREARAAAALSHENIVPIYQVGRDDRDAPFLVMPLLKGVSLRDHFPANAPLSEPEILRLAADVAAGLSVAHQAGLIHRDIKPANLWVESGTGRVKILDFGLARNLHGGGGLTKDGQILGTPDHMSPEQIEGQPIDGRTDLFSLGCVLYRAATGQTAFSGDSWMKVLRRVTDHDPLPPQQLNPELSPQLSSLVLRLLAKKPDDRFRDCEELLAALAKIKEFPTPPVKPTPAPASNWRRYLLPAGVLLAVGTAALVLWGFPFPKPVVSDPPALAAEVPKVGVVADPTSADSQNKVHVEPAVQSPPNESPVPYDLKRTVPDEFSNTFGMKFRAIDAGEFVMGASNTDKDADARVERPAHRVRISKPFYLAMQEVTQSQFEQVMKKNPSYWTMQNVMSVDANPKSPSANQIRTKPIPPDIDRYPVDSVTLPDAIEFCRRLSELEANRTYRLPTEAEWEYACRAGSTTRFPTGDEVESVYKIAHVAGAPGRPDHPLPTGSLSPNAWGLYDLNGNVREWCSNAWAPYSAEAVVDPQGPSEGKRHAVRGGCFAFRALDGRSSSRFGLDEASINRGFRVVLEIPSEIKPEQRKSQSQDSGASQLNFNNANSIPQRAR